MEYKQLKQVYPDIDKVSKLAHFTVYWERHPMPDRTLELANRKSELSQKKEDNEQFFSVVDEVELDNGRVMVERAEKYKLYRRDGDQWVGLEDLTR